MTRFLHASNRYRSCLTNNNPPCIAFESRTAYNVLMYPWRLVSHFNPSSLTARLIIQFSRLTSGTTDMRLDTTSDALMGLWVHTCMFHNVDGVSIVERNYRRGCIQRCVDVESNSSTCPSLSSTFFSVCTFSVTQTLCTKDRLSAGRTTPRPLLDFQAVTKQVGKEFGLCLACSV